MFHRANFLQVCIATGKARGPWCNKVLPKLGKPMPGVYIQVGSDFWARNSRKKTWAVKQQKAAQH